MLNGIKSLINQKKNFMEAADLLLENDELDDSIILSEKPIDTEDEKKPDEVEPTEVMPAKEGELNSDEGLPTPVGAQTGEPITGDTTDILSAEIDLATNTMTDVLPTPPANAGDAVVDDDILNQSIDSGFGEEEPKEGNDDILNNEIPSSEEPVSDPVPSKDEPQKDEVEDLLNSDIEEKCGDTTPITEAITVEGSKDEGTPEEGEKQEGENEVTAAVKDKVADANLEVPGEDPDAATDDEPVNSEELPPVSEEPVVGEEPVDTEDNSNEGFRKSMYDKLASLTNQIEDTKKMLISSMK